MNLIRRTIAVAIAVTTALPIVSQAASSSDTTVPLSAGVNLQFSVLIPQFIFLRVGDATLVNTLAYAPSVADMANSTPVLATGGDVSGSDVTVRVLGNAGNLTLAASALANLTGPGTMPGSTLSGAFQTGGVAVPAFGASVPLPATSGIVNGAGTWRYSWTNEPPWPTRQAHTQQR